MSGYISDVPSETYMKYRELLFPQVIPVAPLHIMYAHQQRIVHDLDLFQKLCIPPELLCKESLLFRPKL
jgi:hypothetical protein